MVVNEHSEKLKQLITTLSLLLTANEWNTVALVIVDAIKELDDKTRDRNRWRQLAVAAHIGLFMSEDEIELIHNAYTDQLEEQ